MADSIGARIVFNLFKGLLLIIALILFSTAYVLNSDNIKISNWQNTTAIVIDNSIVTKTGRTLGKEHNYYSLDISYKYKVDGKIYQSSGLFYKNSPKNHNYEFYAAIQEKLKSGKKVKVFYNPKNPVESYLIADKNDGLQSFYEVSKTLLYAVLALFLITPFFRLFKEKKYIEHNTFEQGLIVPDNAKRIQPQDRYR